MHAHFMMRGDKDSVDMIIRWLQTRIFIRPVRRGKKIEKEMLSGVIRYSVFGTWEYIFPEGEADAVLTTFGFHRPLHPNTAKMRWFVRLLRLAMGLKKPKDFDTSKELVLPLEYRPNVSFIPIGVYYDIEREFPKKKAVQEAL